MKLFRISFLLLLFLLVPPVSRAQSAANKSWNPFWTQFSSAVKSKNKAAVKRLMVAENKFLAGGNEARDEWLARTDKEKLWNMLEESVAKGTTAYKEGNVTERITKDLHLIFKYTNGKWRFAGVYAD